jgi:hypothetical protein
MILNAIKTKTRKSKYKQGLIKSKVKKEILFAHGILNNQTYFID